MDQIFSAARRVGKVHHAVSERLCKVSAKTDVTMRYLLAKADRKWIDTYGIRRVSPSSIVDNLMQIGVIVAGLDPVPAIPERRENLSRTSDEAA